ncbi:glycerophosphodiester phosphodiesterase family protein [Sphingomonas sanguinis]|uniref:Glycerophosphodiester phosphodiesterase family protein n=1 Tax=Sphingomonas sanguinis TaxID=33051 RepID=A0ABU5LKK6_9SPHN|nr:glycerophosphodiester phosphodiesterase family protein [Sphingomonas sanguinis]MDZ7280467.1 glycerophosphodiester phosphodiesterase family protein [Sphingomonas sanguinis]QXT36133.1 glycerophosphodiester phosphodiesterase family protein [Sphingomonas sanguinis]
MYRPLMALALACMASSAQASPADTMRRIRDPQGGLIVIAHRGCHEAAPLHRLGTTPENSAAALAQCVAIGADVMETDVRRSRDGYLVIMHDDRVDRTTDGTGKVADLSLTQLKALHLRQDEGGPAVPLTDQRVLTLDEMLALAKDRIILNLDVKDAIYGEVVNTVHRAGAQDRVIVKTFAGVASQPLAAIAPYDRVPFAPIPITAEPNAADVPQIIEQQMRGGVKPLAVELPALPLATLPSVMARAKAVGVPIWVNTLFKGFVTGMGGDPEARRDPAAVWGRLADMGVRLIQTDAVEALVRYRAARERR